MNNKQIKRRTFNFSFSPSSLFILCAGFLTLNLSFALQMKMLVNGIEAQHFDISTDKAQLVELSFFDRNTGEKITDFEAMHEKFMHMVIVKEDLSTFAHVHPTYDPQRNVFYIVLNRHHEDEDNEAANTALEKEGRYLLYTEVKRKKLGSLKKTETKIEVLGEDIQLQPKLDQMDNNQTITKYFNQDGTLGSEGSFYRARLKIARTPAAGGHENIHFRLNLNEKDSSTQDYAPLSNPQTWLMMAAHGLLLSLEENVDGKRSFAHAHTMAIPPKGEDYKFNEFNRGQWNGKTAKFWIQLKSHDKILSLPFVFEL